TRPRISGCGIDTPFCICARHMTCACRTCAPRRRRTSAHPDRKAVPRRSPNSLPVQSRQIAPHPEPGRGAAATTPSRITEAATPAAIQRLAAELGGIREQGLFKSERIIAGPQSGEIELADGRRVLNFCANNYLGLADHPEVIQAAKDALDSHGFGMASVRFICGTQDLHKALEAKIAAFFGTEDTILYAACFDANGGLYEPLLGPEDAIISDALNHASIIDGVRLCKAKRYRYANCDMADLE